MKLHVDLNADLGEGAGHDEELFELITSANIATGFHAGDADSKRAAISAAKARGVAVGAHPSFFDRENFGRQELAVTADEVLEAVTYQLGVFQAIADRLGCNPITSNRMARFTTWRCAMPSWLTRLRAG
jgi:UPF0271 protein